MFPHKPAFAPPTLLRTFSQSTRLPTVQRHARTLHTPRASAGGVLLCPGQGAQKLTMGRSWAAASPIAAEVLEAADEQLGEMFGDLLSNIVFSGEKEVLDRTDVAQPAIFATSMAIWKGMLDLGLYDADKLTVTAGLSLGEYTALAIAGAISFEDGLRLVTLRGKAMQDAADETRGGMVALVGVDEEKANEVASECRKGSVLVAANFNAPGQVVLSGELAAIDRVLEFGEKHGIRAIKLDVAGAFHSPLMQPAADKLEKALAEVNIGLPSVPVCSNVTGGLHVVGDIREALVRQLTEPVRWGANLQMIRADDKLGGGDIGWTEVGPGKTLSGIMKKIDRKVAVVNYDQPPVLSEV